MKDLSKVNGLVFRDGDDIRHNESREKIEDLDSLPYVSSVYKKHLDHKKYFFAAANYPMLMIIAGRGCPFRCFFCVYPQVMHGRKYRPRSPENVVGEFEYIIKNFPDVREIGIEDDCFTADKNRVRQICDLLIQRRIKIKWYCNARGNLDLDLIKLMKKAGCRLIIVSFKRASKCVIANIPRTDN